MNNLTEFKDMPDDWKQPEWLDGCPISNFDWVTYKRKVYCADLDWESSKSAKKPIFNLAYCITKAMNEIWLKKGIVYENKNIKLTKMAN